MNTQILKVDEIDTAALIIQNGGVVAFPTETVYGLGANALNPSAIDKIFTAKGRPGDNPLIVHVATFQDIESVAQDISESAKRLIKAFMPGSFTAVLRKRNCIPSNVTAGLNTVAVRMPVSPVALELIKKSGVPIAAPSANLSGKPSPTSAKHVIDDLFGRIDAIIDGGSCPVGIESTVVDLSGDIPILLRPGIISVEQIKSIAGEIISPENLENDHTPKSPGMKYRHYAPKAKVNLVCGDYDYITESILSRAYSGAGILTFDEYVDAFTDGKSNIIGNWFILSLGSIDKPESAAHNLYDCLRRFDENNVSEIFAYDLPHTPDWEGVRNRLYKSAE